MGRKVAVETMVADTMLQRGQVEQIGGVQYEVAPPVCATLILASEIIATKLPAVKLDTNNVVIEVLRVAKDAKALGDLAAVLVLGYNGLIERRKIVKKHLFGLFKREAEVVINKREELAKTIIETMGPKELNLLMSRLLNSMEVDHFFGLTTSLTEINITRPTKEVV